MQDQITRKLFLSFIQIHILHHARIEPIYGTWMLEELSEHGYELSPGTLYPLLHQLYNSNLLSREDILVDGRIRKYYRTTELGIQVLKEARNKASILLHEIEEEQDVPTDKYHL